MKYYSEEDVKDLYEWGCGKTDPPLENYPSIEIRTPHGRLIDAYRVKAKIVMGTTCEEKVSLKDILSFIDGEETVLDASKKKYVFDGMCVEL